MLLYNHIIIITSATTTHDAVWDWIGHWIIFWNYFLGGWGGMIHHSHVVLPWLVHTTGLKETIQNPPGRKRLAWILTDNQVRFLKKKFLKKQGALTTNGVECLNWYECQTNQHLFGNCLADGCMEIGSSTAQKVWHSTPRHSSVIMLCQAVDILASSEATGRYPLWDTDHRMIRVAPATPCPESNMSTHSSIEFE